MALGMITVLLLALTTVLGQPLDACKTYAQKFGCIAQFQDFCKNTTNFQNETEFLEAWQEFAPREDKQCYVPFPTFFVEEIALGVVLLLIFLLLRGVEVLCFPLAPVGTPPSTPERRASV